MKIIKRTREFFTSLTGVTSDLKYLSGPNKGKMKTFINGGIPDQNIFQNFFASIPFFNEPNDKATATKTGLVKLAADLQALLRQAPADNYTIVVIPEQIPTINNLKEGETTVDFVTAHLTADHLTHEKVEAGLAVMYTKLRVGNSERQVIRIRVVPKEPLIINESGELEFDVPEQTLTVLTDVTYNAATDSLVKHYKELQGFYAVNVSAEQTKTISITHL